MSIEALEGIIQYRKMMAAQIQDLEKELAETRKELKRWRKLCGEYDMQDFKELMSTRITQDDLEEMRIDMIACEHKEIGVWDFLK